MTALLSFLLDQNDLGRLITKILRQVFFLRHPQGLARTSSPLFCLAVWERELETGFSEEHCHAGGMPVHHRLLVGTIANMQDPHFVIFEVHSVVLCIYFDWV